MTTRIRNLLLLALVAIFAGGLIAWRTQTVGGRVEVRDIRWVDASGRRMSGLLYVPETATPETPAPGILAVHGYINSRETQSGFAIEFARRGYVVLALDQTGHGYSDPPAFAGGFGGPAGLAYLRSLDFVDRDNIGLEGHSMGGWASGMAAAAMPDGYRAMALVGSSTGSLGVPQGTPEWPRNVAVIFSIWDEFSPTMWGTPVAWDVGRAPKLQALFGVEDEVRPNKVYGSIEEGTARILYQPRTNHPGDHHSREAIGDAIEWFSMTLEGGSDLPPDDQIWYWKELGAFISTVGMVLLFFPVAMLLLRTRYFGDLNAEAPAPVVPSGRAGWWGAAAVTALLGPVTLFPFKDLPGRVGWSASPLFPQSLTNGVVAWTTALALITLVLLVVWHFALARRRGGGTDAYGLTRDGRWEPARIGKSLLLAFLVVLAGYLSLAVTAYLFTTDFRIFVFAIKPMSPAHLRMALIYFLPFAFFFLVLNTAVHAQLRRESWSTARAMAATVAVLAGGYVFLYLYQYVPLLSGGTMGVADEALWTIISYQLLPIMTIVGLLLAYLNRRTGTIYAGSFAAAMFVAWVVVASQATHVG